MSNQQPMEPQLLQDLRRVHELLTRVDIYSLEMGKWDQHVVLEVMRQRKFIHDDAYRLAEEAIRGGHNRDTIVADVLRQLGIDAHIPRF